MTIEPPSARLSPDFWRFWIGQSVSNLGNSVTAFAIPLLIYKLTGSAVNLGLASAVQMLPYLLFGLVIGAWVDRVDRKRLMIAADISRALIMATVPILAWMDSLSVWWVYGAGFLSATISIAFDGAQFAAIPSLVPSNDLVTANGRIQASFSAAMIAGPLLAGALISAISVETILLIDAASFLFSALFLSLVRQSFNQLEREEKRTSIRQDIGEGLRYVWSHPVLRSISIMMALVNFVGSTLSAQLVLFAKERLHADDSELGILFAGEAAGVVILALVAGTLRKRFSFSTVALGSLLVSGVICVVFAYLTNFWIALPLWTLFGGLGILFNINTGSLRQSIVPNDMLGRVISVAGVVAWSAIPLGTILGGIAIEQTGDVALVYAVIGGLITLIAFCFRFTALGHAERYLPPDNAAPSGES